MTEKEEKIYTRVRKKEEEVEKDEKEKTEEKLR